MTTAADGPEEVDLDALDLGPMLRHARTATFAPNWRSVLAADAFVGLMIILGGVLASRWMQWVGRSAVSLGVIYVFLVIRRFLQWRWLRREAGL